MTFLTLTKFSVGRPSPPLILNVVPESTTVNISWSTNLKGSDVIHKYEIQYNYTFRECQNSSNDILNILFVSPSKWHTLTNLEEDSDLTISLVAVNPAGSSEETVVNTATLQSGYNMKLGILLLLL